LVDTSDHPEISPTVLFHRLLSAFVPCDERPHRVKGGGHVTGRMDFSEFRPSMFPENFAGTSRYSQVSFEQKLILEVKALDLMPDMSMPKLTDNEVMNAMVEKRKELEGLLAVSNGLRKTVLTELEDKQETLLARAALSRQFVMTAPKPEVAQKRSQKRTKSGEKFG
jgi:hypothetical protein